jgi:N-acyl-D-aspartate/D-glutamate deacylase
MRRSPWARWIVASAVLLAFPAVGRAAPPTYDLVIRNGTVFDGTGLPGQRADVAIDGDRIVRVGDLKDAKGRVEQDATGLYVTPGFVSLHDHSTAEAYKRPEGLLTQGITTAITNPDGRGTTDIVGQLSTPGGLGLNYGAYIGFNAVWAEVMGLSDHRASPANIEAMQGIVRKTMEQGAFGLSAGLDYKPGFWATTAEVVEIARAAGPWRTNFPNHDRVYPGNGYSSLAGMAETLEIGKQSGVMPVITHLKLQGRDAGKTEVIFGMIQGSIDHGTPVGVDAYPYGYGTTTLDQLLIPAWAQEGGRDAMLKRFADPALRPRIAAETRDQMDARWNGAAGVYLPEIQKELTAVMQEMGGVPAGEAVMRLLEQGKERVILRFGTDSDLQTILKDTRVAISCDCGASTTNFGHPRYWGSFPRFLGLYVREQKLVSWEEAVRKMTALPATILGLSERGYLLPGMIADLTLFDPKTVLDKATLETPMAPSVGIRDVIINGRAAVKDGKLTGGPAGMRLARSKHEPSRPMNFDIDRSVSAKGAVTGDGVRVAIEVNQAANARRPTGRIRISGLPGGKGLAILEPSILQTSQGWASVTGMGSWSDGRAAPVTVIVEQADPFAHGQPTVTVLADGAEIAGGALPARAVTVRQAGAGAGRP